MPTTVGAWFWWIFSVGFAGVIFSILANIATAPVQKWLGERVSRIRVRNLKEQEYIERLVSEMIEDPNLRVIFEIQLTRSTLEMEIAGFAFLFSAMLASVTFYIWMGSPYIVIALSRFIVLLLISVFLFVTVVTGLVFILASRVWFWKVRVIKVLLEKH